MMTDLPVPVIPSNAGEQKDLERKESNARIA
jgi:hypothetical protein